MSKAIVVMNHVLSDEQVEDLRNFGPVGDVVHLPAELKPLWAQIPPELDREGVVNHIQPVLDWIDNEFAVDSTDPEYPEPDMIIVSGEPTATFAVVRHVRESQGYSCYAATTRRESVEKTTDDGSVVKTNVFKHVRFRQI